MKKVEESDWLYSVCVPSEKSNDFIRAMISLGLFDDEYLDVTQEGE